MVASPPRRRGPHRQGDDATVYTDRWKWPLDAVSGYLCTLLRREDRVSSRDDATVYTDRWKWPLGAVSGHLCTLLHRESRYESRRELRQDQVRWHALCRPMRLPLCLIIASCAHLKQIIIYLMPSLANYGHSPGVKTYDPQFEKRCPSCMQPEGQHCVAIP
mgnify:FL=1